MRILITGGRGTIGNVLTYQLRKKGYDVWTCDLAHHYDAGHIRCDVAGYRNLLNLFESKSFDFVFHLAAEYGRWNGEDYYEQLWRSNVIGTKNILRLQEQFGFRLVFTSTSEVYGDIDDVMSEDLMEKVEIRQLNDYAISKWVNELQILNSASMHGIKAVRVRLFNTYGPGEYYTDYRSAICRFIYSALTDKPYTVYLNHSRSSVFISDTVNTLTAIIGNFIPGEVYNIGGGENHTMKEISDFILSYLGKNDSLVTYLETEPFTTRDKKISIEKAKRDLNYSPVVSLKDGLTRTIDWMRQVYLSRENADPVAFIGDYL